MRARRIASLLIPLVMVAACSDGGADPFGKPPATTNGVTPDGTANWTLLVYMAPATTLVSLRLTTSRDLWL